MQYAGFCKEPAPTSPILAWAAGHAIRLDRPTFAQKHWALSNTAYAKDSQQAVQEDRHAVRTCTERQCIFCSLVGVKFCASQLNSQVRPSCSVRSSHLDSRSSSGITCAAASLSLSNPAGVSGNDDYTCGGSSANTWPVPGQPCT